MACALSLRLHACTVQREAPKDKSCVCTVGSRQDAVGRERVPTEQANNYYHSSLLRRTTRYYHRLHTLKQLLLLYCSELVSVAVVVVVVCFNCPMANPVDIIFNRASC